MRIDLPTNKMCVKFFETQYFFISVRKNKVNVSSKKQNLTPKSLIFKCHTY